jgi:hypothetical protein
MSSRPDTGEAGKLPRPPRVRQSAPCQESPEYLSVLSGSSAQSRTRTGEASPLPRPPAMTEAELLKATTDLADVFGWRWCHQRPARTQHGWRTAISGSQGWVDLVLIHPIVGALFVELKTEKGRTTTDQDAWLEALRGAGLDARVWRPSSWPEIVRELTNGKGAT